MRLVSILLILLSACGRLGTVEHHGNVSTVVSFDMKTIEKYFRVKCVADLQASSGMFPATWEVDYCTNMAVADFLTVFSSMEPVTSE